MFRESCPSLMNKTGFLGSQSPTLSILTITSWKQLQSSLVSATRQIFLVTHLTRHAVENLLVYLHIGLKRQANVILLKGQTGPKLSTGFRRSAVMAQIALTAITRMVAGQNRFGLLSKASNTMVAVPSSCHGITTMVCFLIYSRPALTTASCIYLISLN